MTSGWTPGPRDTWSDRCRRVLTGRTVVAITHRLHTASDADRLPGTEDGRVSELGSDEVPLALGGSYVARAVSRQSQGVGARRAAPAR